MRELTQKLRGLLLLPAFIGCSLASAQVTCRVPQTASTQKTEGITAEVPCAGSVLLSEDFANGIPVGWTVIDGDTLTPRAQMQLQKGWQSRTDYRDSSNKVVVSPSWYENPGKSDDWLITPPITLGSNPCLSWKAYSQDIYYKEAYEVRVALTPDTAAFLANAVIDEDDATSGTPHQLAATLGAWAGQTVYIAFRQVSDDKFVLALDDVKVTNVNVNDIGVYAVTYGSPDPGDTV
ncbi:MAG TPA: choice-of-anchor J domain-containing protein, partial [Bacteroidia bacterium]|nr:choice-of-anchor J domain-containing protein [Bacteroidia bacterium]